MSDQATLPKVLPRSEIKKILKKLKPKELIIIYWIDSGVSCETQAATVMPRLTSGFFDKTDGESLISMHTIDCDPESDNGDAGFWGIWIPSICGIFKAKDEKKWQKYIERG